MTVNLHPSKKHSLAADQDISRQSNRTTEPRTVPLRPAVVALVPLILALAGCAGVGNHFGNQVDNVTLDVLSSPSPQWTSGGDALIRINGKVPPSARLSHRYATGQKPSHCAMAAAG